MRRSGTVLIWGVLMVTACALRCGGLFRGLDTGDYFHPDEPKQVVALGNYLQGHYLWYVGNPYYDGYPLALNHVDEWLLRPVMGWVAAWREHLGLHVPRETDLFQDRHRLTYWARGLRALYGMICVVLAYGVARWCGLSRPVGWGAALLLAVSPLSVTVAHTATGDIGTDLFVGLALGGLCLYARRDRLPWLFVSGALTGAAFACKYNGALGGLAIALFVAWEAAAQRSVRRFLVRGAMAFGGFLAGAVLMTPAFFIDARQTWRDMRMNFGFIQEYGASRQFLAKPFLERVALSWQGNTPRLLHAVTVSVAVLAAVGAGVAVWRAVRRRDTNDARRLRLHAAVFALPFLAIAVSMIGKPEVQPFHFSYLQLPLAIAAAYGLAWIGSRGKPGRLVAVALLIWTGVDLWGRNRAEQFFWKRTDNAFVARDMQRTLLNDRVPDDGWGRVRRIDLEPDNPSVFRNRKHSVKLPLADFWNRVPVPPTPCVPYPRRHDWIFLNGPLFPRNDRMLHVRPGHALERRLVSAAKRPGPVRIGLRTGHLPAAVNLSLGGVRREWLLPPESQVEAELDPKTWRRSRTRSRSEPVEPLALIPLRTETRMGPVWITVMANEAERLRYRLFSGGDAPPSAIMPLDAETELTARNLDYTSFLDSGDAPPVMLAADGSARRTLALSADGMALPAGAYTVTCRVNVLSESAEVAVAVKDAYRFVDWPTWERRALLEPGMQDVRVCFSKSFVPYECFVKITCLQGACELRSWSVQPDYAAMTAALAAWQGGGERPGWLRRFPAVADPSREALVAPAVFGGCIEVRDFALPSSAVQGEPLTLHCGAVLSRPCEAVEGSAFFVHLRDRTGRQLYADGFEVWEALAAKTTGAEIVCKTPLNVPPGQYRVELGVWNTRTEKRLPVKAGNLSRRDKRKRRVHMGTLRVEE